MTPQLNTQRVPGSTGQGGRDEGRGRFVKVGEEGAKWYGCLDQA